MQNLSREKFEEEYRLWINSAAKDVASALNRLKPDEIRNIIARNEQYLEKPGSVFGADGLDSIKKLAPSDIVLLSTDAVVFSQSIFAPIPGVFDYAVAMNRRYYLGSWYSIITLNTMYLEEASETMLKYALFHELLQKEIYEENMRSGVRKFTPPEKRKISNETLNRAIESSGITPDELLQENELMQKVSFHSPLIPKPFAETALYWYMEQNLEEFKQYAGASETKKEEDVGEKLNSDFKGWLDFSSSIYSMFLAGVKKELNYMDYGYA